MIDVRLLRTQPDSVRAALARRAKPDVLEQADHALALDTRLRDITTERDAARARVNELSKQVAELRRAKLDAEAVMAESRALGDREKVLAEEYAQVEAVLRDVLLRIPNLPHDDVTQGMGSDDNQVVRGPEQLPAQFADHQRVPHWETGATLGILDSERAVKISGAMFTMQRGAGAALARALCQYALDRNADAYEEIRPPSLVTTATLTATGQLPKFADEAYSIERDDLWCIPTAEAPLTSLHAGEILDETSLPVRYMAFSPCFRREAGAAGRDTRGMLRSHEFDKVEILAVTTPEQAPAMLDEFVQRVTHLIADLGLPYRLLEICTGDLGQSHHRSFDVEVYAPGCDQWLEVSSVSWFSDYQARRGDIRLRRSGKKGTEFAHTLNASALAVPRVWAAIVENFRTADGSVVIPPVLHPYMRGLTVIRPPQSR
ncbi:MAG: serine--tRNA ligase [Actinobacteria bacterium]|nr:serine--tRNA ligase [Actinomycetota bacterium]NDG77244.1 serine--tRNA ligase [Acidimicrobiia bacterium]NBO80693.1 serine--tRNA ligase [Actinomycetota bacterium]NBP18118.1 serine--tRNA ligase [Actinomycetota bacterium]NBY56848.1 serine--tRNA ligase [Actinomycetota bacterium]